MNKKKKVLLRERKRHIARRVVSTRFAALSRGRGGYPYSVLTWGDYAHPVLMGGGGVTHPVLNWGGGGTPYWPGRRTPPPPHHQTGWGNPTLIRLDGVPPPLVGLDGGTAPSDWWGYLLCVHRQTPVKTVRAGPGNSGFCRLLQLFCFNFFFH